jgi:hypothetical protein
MPNNLIIYFQILFFQVFFHPFDNIIGVQRNALQHGSYFPRIQRGGFAVLFGQK